MSFDYSLFFCSKKSFCAQQKRSYSVKIIRRKNDNFDLALRKRLFCVAKEPLLPCKTYAFGMQNNRFCNALITRWLDNSYTCEKYLHPYRFIFTYIIRYVEAATWVSKKFFLCGKINLFVCLRKGFNITNYSYYTVIQ